MTAKDLLHKYLNYDYLWRLHTEDEPSKIRLQAKLISRFNYPDADLDKLDLDWRIANY